MSEDQQRDHEQNDNQIDLVSATIFLDQPIRALPDALIPDRKFSSSAEEIHSRNNNTANIIRKKSFDWNKDDTEEQTKPEKKKNILVRIFFFIPFWLRTLLFSALITAALLVPPIVYWFIQKGEEERKPLANQDAIRININLGLFNSDISHGWFGIWFKTASVVAVAVSGTIISYFVAVSIPNVTVWFMKILRNPLSENFKLKLQILDSIKIYVTALLVSILLYVQVQVYISMKNENNTTDETNYQFLTIFLMSLTALVLAEKIALQLIAFQFQTVAHADRVEMNKYKSKILDKLSVSVAEYIERGKRSERYEQKDDRLRLGALKSGISGFVRSTTYALKETAGAFIATEFVHVNSAKEARKVAKSLFKSICPPGKNTLDLEDFIPYFETPEEAAEAFSIFDSDGNGNLTKAEMKSTVESIYEERNYLSKSLNTVGTCVAGLDNVLMFFVVIIATYLALIIFNIGFKAVSIIGTTLVSSSFVLGETLKNLFQNLLFLFVVHPYDVGDRVKIDDDELVVESIGINTTTFSGTFNEKIYLANTQIASSSISNFRRSGNQQEKIVIFASPLTPMKSLEKVKARMTTFLEEHPRDYVPKFEYIGSELTQNNSLMITCLLKYKSNFQHALVRLNRKTAFCKQYREVLISEGVVTLPNPTLVDYKVE